MTRQAARRDWDDEDDDEEGYDDSLGYGDDSDEDEEYEEFLEREFGSKGGSRLSRLQYTTVIVLLAVFIVPPLLYFLAALTQ